MQSAAAAAKVAPLQCTLFEEISLFFASVSSFLKSTPPIRNFDARFSTRYISYILAFGFQLVCIVCVS